MKAASYTRSERTKFILDVFEKLPLTERTLLKRLNKYSFELLNDTGDGCLYRVIADGVEMGAIKYYKGRKFCIWERSEQGISKMRATGWSVEEVQS
jgi:hypothetical protein